jgi:hypothetical protein
MLTLLLLQLHDGHESNLDRLIAIYYCHAIAENCMPGARVVFATLFSIFSISFSLAGKRVGWWVVGEVVVEKLEKEGGRRGYISSAAPLPTLATPLGQPNESSGGV